MTNFSKEYLGILSTAAGAVLIGIAPILVRVSEVSPSITGFYRFLIASIVLFFYGLLSGLLKKYTYKDILILSLPGLFFGSDIALWHWSINETSIANASLFVNTAPIYVAVISFILFKEKLDKLFFFACTACLGGVVLILFEENINQSLFGDSLSLLAALFYSGYLITVKRYSNTYSTYEFMLFSALFGSIPLLLGGLIETGTKIPYTMSGISNLFFQGVFIQIAGQGLIIFGLSKIRVQFSSLILLVQPLTAAILAIYLFNEMLLIQQIIGAIILLIGIYLAGASEKKLKLNDRFNKNS